MDQNKVSKDPDVDIKNTRLGRFKICLVVKKET